MIFIHCCILALLVKVIMLGGTSAQLFFSPTPPQKPSRREHPTQRATELLVNRWNDLSTWSEVNKSSSCVQGIIRAIVDFHDGEEWALQFFDSWAKPGPSLLVGRSLYIGNYDQCRQTLAPPVTGNTDMSVFHGEYCTLKFTNMTFLPQMTTWTFSGRYHRYHWLHHLSTGLELLSLMSALGSPEVDCGRTGKEITTSTVLAVILLVTIVSLAVIGTTLDLVLVQWPSWKTSKTKKAKEQTLTENSNSFSSTQEGDKGSGRLLKAFLCFSVYTNGRKILSVTEPPGSISVLNGLRCLATFSNVALHVDALSRPFVGNLHLSLDKEKDSSLANLHLKAFFMTETFLVISGCVLSYSLTKKILASGWLQNWPRFYLHAVWSITFRSLMCVCTELETHFLNQVMGVLYILCRTLPTFLGILILVQGLERFMGSGPLWGSQLPWQRKACEKNWWYNLFFIGNFVPFSDQCLGPFWWNTVNMQLLIIAPLLLVPFYYHKLAGLASCLLAVLISQTTTTIAAYKYPYWPNQRTPVLVSNIAGYMNNLYMAPWCRATPFAIGILTGYVLSGNNRHIKLHRYTVVLGWLAAAILGYHALFDLDGHLTGASPLTKESLATKYALISPFGSLFVSWLIVACASGYGGPVNTLLSWTPFVVLSRLTFVANIVNWNVAEIFYGNMNELFHYSILNVFTHAIAVIVLTYMLSFSLVTGLHLPIMGLENVLF